MMAMTRATTAARTGIRRRGALLWLGAAGMVHAQAPQAAARVVSLGGVLTEIVFALDAADRLVGVDDSSTYPTAAAQLPRVGYYRSFSLEGIASLRPDLVLASDQAGPPHAIERLRSLGLRVVVLPSAPTLQALEERIAGVAAALGRDAQGRQLVGRIRAQIAQAAEGAAQKRVLLVSSHAGRLQGAGRETAADAVIGLAGAKNVLADERGYQALSPESAVALRPDFIVTTTMSVRATGGLDAFLALPGIAVTPAARAKRVVVMDDLLLLGFGPRLPEALRQLQAGLAATSANR